MMQVEISSTTLRLYTKIERIKSNMSRILTPAAEKLGLSPIQLMLLLGLEYFGPATVGGLSRELDMNAGNVSTQCKRLEQTGLLTRTRSLEDERVVNLALTAAGHDLTAEFQDVLDQCGAALDGLAQEKRDAIFAGLDSLAEVINDLARSIGQP